MFILMRISRGNAGLLHAVALHGEYLSDIAINHCLSCEFAAVLAIMVFRYEEHRNTSKGYSGNGIYNLLFITEGVL